MNRLIKRFTTVQCKSQQPSFIEGDLGCLNASSDGLGGLKCIMGKKKLSTNLTLKTWIGTDFSKLGHWLDAIVVKWLTWWTHFLGTDLGWWDSHVDEAWWGIKHLCTWIVQGLLLPCLVQHASLRGRCSLIIFPNISLWEISNYMPANTKPDNHINDAILNFPSKAIFLPSCVQIASPFSCWTWHALS